MGADFDQDFDVIEEGIRDLHGLAGMQGEDVILQIKSLGRTEQQIDQKQEHISNVNSKT